MYKLNSLFFNYNKNYLIILIFIIITISSFYKPLLSVIEINKYYTL